MTSLSSRDTAIKSETSLRNRMIRCTCELHHNRSRLRIMLLHNSCRQPFTKRIHQHNQREAIFLLWEGIAGVPEPSLLRLFTALPVSQMAPPCSGTSSFKNWKAAGLEPSQLASVFRDRYWERSGLAAESCARTSKRYSVEV